MMAFITGLVSNAYVKIIFILVAIIAIGGSAFEIIHLKDKNEITQANVAKITDLNTSLNKHIEDLKFQNSQVIAELQRAKVADSNSQARLRESSAKYSSEHKKQQITNAYKRNPQNLVDLINKNSECNMQHFEELGKCVNGNWVSQK